MKKFDLSVSFLFRQNLLLPTVSYRLVEKYMEKNCPIYLLPDITNVPNVEAWLKVAAAEQKACESKGYYKSLDSKFSIFNCESLTQMAFLNDTHHSGSDRPWQQVKLDQLYVVILTDFTKVGVLTTQVLNKHAALISRLLSRNQTRILSYNFLLGNPK